MAEIWVPAPQRVLEDPTAAAWPSFPTGQVSQTADSLWRQLQLACWYTPVRQGWWLL